MCEGSSFYLFAHAIYHDSIVWYHNKTPIAVGDTLWFSPARLTDSGFYYVVAFGAGGSDTSRSVQLWIYPNNLGDVVTPLSVTDTIFCEGDSITLTFHVANATWYRWEHNGSWISDGSSRTSITISGLDMGGHHISVIASGMCTQKGDSIWFEVIKCTADCPVDTVFITDTLTIFDTIIQIHFDTITQIDTFILIQMDTVWLVPDTIVLTQIVLDTIIQIEIRFDTIVEIEIQLDTITLFDTIIRIDTIVKYDTIIEIVITEPLPQSTVRFHAPGAISPIPPQTVTAGDRVSIPADPIHSNPQQVFVGWYVDPSNGSSIWHFGTYVVTGSLDLYARWVNINSPNLRTVAFNPQDNVASSSSKRAKNVPSTRHVEQGWLVMQPSNPIMEGFIFAGWFKEPECITAWNFLVDVAVNNMTLYAKWIEGVPASNVKAHNHEALQVFPNPVNYELRITNDEWKQGEIVELFDINGRRVYSAPANNSEITIDMSLFQIGNYILRIGNRTTKVVKQ
jgi:uncharacterized repeat protein (TIGR02543 family)